MLTKEKFEEIGNKKRDIHNVLSPAAWKEISDVFVTCRKLFEDVERLQFELNTERAAHKDSVAMMAVALERKAALLRRLEHASYGDCDEPMCPICHEEKPKHEPDCELAKELNNND